MRRDIAKLLETGQEATARIRVSLFFFFLYIYLLLLFVEPLILVMLTMFVSMKNLV